MTKNLTAALEEARSEIARAGRILHEVDQLDAEKAEAAKAYSAAERALVKAEADARLGDTAAQAALDERRADLQRARDHGGLLARLEPELRGRLADLLPVVAEAHSQLAAACREDLAQRIDALRRELVEAVKPIIKIARRAIALRDFPTAADRADDWLLWNVDVLGSGQLLPKDLGDPEKIDPTTTAELRKCVQPVREVFDALVKIEERASACHGERYRQRELQRLHGAGAPR